MLHRTSFTAVVLGGVFTAALAAGQVKPLASSAQVRPQSRRPQAEVSAAVESTRVIPTADVRLSLKVRLPDKVHVQSDKPRDPLLIPTLLTLDLPKGLTLAGITYPKSTDLKQVGQTAPLAVFEREFAIGVRVKVASDVKAGTVIVPGHLRYQACDETTCYAPLKADTQWTLNVTRP